MRLPHLDILPPFDDESNHAWDALLVRSYVGARQWNGLFVSLHDGVPPLFPCKQGKSRLKDGDSEKVS